MPLDERVRIHQAMQDITNKQREAAQAAPRPARIRFTIRTAGTGETRLLGGAALKFGAQMMDEPSFSFGLIAGEPLRQGQLPLATATVLRYLVTNSGLYYGAEMAFKVESAKYDIRLKYSLTFEGTTLRSTAGSGGDSQIVARGGNTFRGDTSNQQYLDAASNPTVSQL